MRLAVFTATVVATDMLGASESSHERSVDPHTHPSTSLGYSGRVRRRRAVGAWIPPAANEADSANEEEEEGEEEGR